MSPTTGLEARIKFQRGDFELSAEITVGAGEILAVLGPNGSGKTTLLRILAGLLSVTEGFVTVAGEAWDDAETGRFISSRNRSVALVFQDYRLFPHLSVLDNVAFGPRSRGTRRRRARAAAAAMLRQLDLTELAGRRPGQLSGGQAQRVALARALATQPRMLLLDEPLAALDAGTKMQIRTEIRRWLTDFDGPSIVVTHDPLEALVLADRILVLEAGRIVQQGTPAQVARRPTTAYVARMMGLNLYTGTLIDPQTHRVDLTGDGGVFYAAARVDDVLDPLARNTPMLVALAPSAITVHTFEPGPVSSRNVWPGQVSGVELLTDRVRIEVSGRPNALVDVTPAAVAELGLVAGQQVWLSAKASEVLAYPDPA